MAILDPYNQIPSLFIGSNTFTNVIPMSQNIFLQNLVAYWKFNNSLVDEMGNYDLTGTAGFTDGLFSQSNGAYNVANSESNAATRGIDDSIFDFSTSEDITISIWVKISSVSAEQNIIEKLNNGAGPGWTLYKTSSGQPVQIAWVHPGGTVVIEAPGGLPSDGNYHHLVVLRKDMKISLIANNIRFNSAIVTSPMAGVTQPLIFGARDGAQNSPLNGSIDECAIWVNRALTDSEISQLYNGGVGLPIL